MNACKGVTTINVLGISHFCWSIICICCHCFPVFISPETIQIYKDAYHCIPLATEKEINVKNRTPL